MNTSAEQVILDFLARYVDISKEDPRQLLDDIPYGEFEKGTYLLREGQVPKACYFVLKGLVRQYELVDGEEKTTFFYTEENAIVEFESSSAQTPTRMNWVCEEDCLLVIGWLDKIEDAYERNPKLETMSRLFMGEDVAKYKELATSFITLKPEERYRLLMEKRPDLLNRVPQYHLASYLGIKPETLSRIRKRMFQKA